MSYMIEHKEFGIYQGECLGFGFWYPISAVPEQGLCEFEIYSDAQEYIDFLCSEDCADQLNADDLEILHFDEDLNTRLLGELAFREPYLEMRNKVNEK